MQHPERVKLLLHALRSGMYKQAQGMLRSDDGDCCLGVACDVYRLATGDGEWTKRVRHARGQMDFNVDDEGPNPYSLPRRVASWYGFQDEGGDFYYPSGSRESLASLNDNGASFEEIANVIESEPRGLFQP